MKTLAIKLSKTFYSVNNSYPKYRSGATRRMNVGTKNNPNIVEVLVYRDSKEFRRDFDNCPDGCSAVFIPNNAKIDSANQFALKIFYDKCDAYLTWQRQKLAAKIGLAPPVGKMVVVLGETGKIKHLGYQTAVCDMSQSEDIPRKLVSKLRKNLSCIKLTKKCLGDDCETDDGEIPKLGDDLHEDNYGIWKGNLVCIDFGNESLSSYDVPLD